jgi:hypothetical protein
VDQRSGGDEAVFDGHRVPGGAKTCQQLRPPQARLRLPRQAAEPLNTRVEPPLEADAPPAVVQQENAEAQFAEDDGSTAISRSLSHSHSTTLASGTRSQRKRATSGNARPHVLSEADESPGNPYQVAGE